MTTDRKVARFQRRLEAASERARFYALDMTFVDDYLTEDLQVDGAYRWARAAAHRANELTRYLASTKPEVPE